ncbi:Ulp1 protease family, C-terminal catalytic domain [Sesbania bispinosa]|nr:Ulp1 protease family, C-terminal catalytic domain [Sesbania bispinosa]
MTNPSKSKGKTPLRLSNRKRARRSKPEAAESRGSFDGEVIHTHTLTVKKKKPQIVEISSMDTGPEKDNNFDININMEYEDDLNPIKKLSLPENNPLENRVDKMENKMDRFIDTIETLAKMFVGISAKTRGMVLVTTTTSSDYYLNARNNEEVKGVKEMLIGKFEPQCLKDIFKPTSPIALSKAEAAVASYIFCHSLNKEVDRKEVIVRTNLEYCEGQRILFQSLKPKGEIEQDVFIPLNDDNYHWYLVVIDFVNKEEVYLNSFPSQYKRVARLRSVHTVALYMENLLQYPNFYRVEPLEKPQISKWPIYEPEGISRQNAESNDCGAWVITWMVEMGVDEGTRLRIALDLALNPGNILQEEVIDKAEAWFESLDAAAGGDHVETAGTT